MAFQDWLDEWKDEIEAMQLFTKSELPRDPGQIQDDLSRTTRDYPRAAELLADVEGFVITTRSVETLAVRTEYDDLAAPERRVVVEARLAPLLRTRDILKATVAALHERSFALMNQRKYAEAELRMTPRGAE